MIQSMNPFLNFEGNASEALELYASVLGGEVVQLMRFSDMPTEPGQQTPPELANQIMYAKLATDAFVLEMSDCPPGVPRTDLPASSKTSTAMPRPRACSSPRQTGPVGSPSAKQEMMSVPPEIEARWRSSLIAP